MGCHINDHDDYMDMYNWNILKSLEIQCYKRNQFTFIFHRRPSYYIYVSVLFQDRNINIIAGTTVENKGKLILTEIFPSVQKHDIFQYLQEGNDVIKDCDEILILAAIINKEERQVDDIKHRLNK